MDDKVGWGVLGVANIAVRKVIPAMRSCERSRVTAIASRDLRKAEEAAKALEIPRAYGSYEELLADPDVEVIYNPLPNHLHAEWSIKAAQARKHVLCEKPITVNVEEALSLIEVRDLIGVRIQEAFMIRTHPQWIGALELIRKGMIGPVRSVAGFFSYYNRDPENIRNVLQYGGGALMDIGCYLIYSARLAFGEEPRRVMALIEREPQTRTDILTSAILDFPSGQAIFTCSTQLTPYQTVSFFGTRARIEIEIPFNAPPDRPCRIFVDDGSSLTGESIRTVEFETSDQYTIQADLFSRSIREDIEPAIPLEDSVANIAVIEALFESARSGRWETPYRR